MIHRFLRFFGASLLVATLVATTGCSSSKTATKPDETKTKVETKTKKPTRLVSVPNVLQFDAVLNRCKVENPFTPFVVFQLSSRPESSIAYVHMNSEIANFRKRPNSIVIVAVDANAKLSYLLPGSRTPTSTEFRTGDVVQIPTGVGYQLNNVGNEPCQFLVVFTEPLGSLIKTDKQFLEKWGLASLKDLKNPDSVAAKSPIIPYNVLDFAAQNSKVASTRSQVVASTSKVTVTAATTLTPLQPHYHPKAEEVFIVLGGGGRFYLERPSGALDTHKLRPGSMVHVPKGIAHSFKPNEGTRVILLTTHSPQYTTDGTVSAKWKQSKDTYSEWLKEEEKKRKENQAKEIRAQRNRRVNGPVNPSLNGSRTGNSNIKIYRQQ